MKPTFHIIGTAKAATSSLSRSLNLHPDIFIWGPDEVHFFSFDDVFEQGFAWYEALFEAAAGKAQRGEKSNSYTVRKHWPDAAQRLLDYNPSAKLIYMVRDPLKKIESLWLELRGWRNAKSIRHFEEVAVNQHEMVHHSFDTALRDNVDFLVEPANYWKELEPYRERFPDEQILVLFFEEFKADPARELAKCLAFLDVEPMELHEARESHLNRSSDKRVPSKALSLARSVPGFRALKGLVPSGLKRMTKPMLHVPAQRPEWKRSTRRRVLDTLRDDTERFLEHYGRPKDLWNLEP